jgi:hypothetical protein
MLMRGSRGGASIISRRSPGLRHAAKKPQVPGIYIPTEDRVDPAIPSVPTPGEYADWRDDPRFQDIKRLPQGRQQRDLKLGPYAGGVKGRKWFVSPAKDPVTFIVNCLLIGITVYTVANMSWGESYFVKRKRLIKERIRQQYGLPEGWDDAIDDEGFDEEFLKATPGEEAKALEARGGR